MNDEVLKMKEQKLALELKLEEIELKKEKLREEEDVIKIQMFFLNKELASTLNKICRHENIVVVSLGCLSNEGYCKDCGYQLYDEFNKTIKHSLKPLDDRDMVFNKTTRELIFDKIKNGEYEDPIFNQYVINQINDDCKHNGGKLISRDSLGFYCSQCGYNIVEINGCETVVYPIKASENEELLLLKNKKA